MTSHTWTNGTADAKRAVGRMRLVDISAMEKFGTIKWFDREKRYGFIEPDDGGRDVFLHLSVAQLYGIRPELLVKGLRVAFNEGLRAGRGSEATAIGIA